MSSPNYAAAGPVYWEGGGWHGGPSPGRLPGRLRYGRWGMQGLSFPPRVGGGRGDGAESYNRRAIWALCREGVEVCQVLGSPVGMFKAICSLTYFWRRTLEL
ncbi:hypothetical protein EVAR_9251_1 [Eumeta japonica]|uniref:Uncharacterized protein n=1 Tax=Eumeta variegata TaxID=151549 RepID=A0A4C1TMX3_EUMVA|nr:hypothetical protein EVAR_9251_1 [Eumeta japonica]